MARGDIQLPNNSGRIDPRIATAEYERSRKAESTRSTTAKAAPPSMLSRMRSGFRTFAAKGRR